MTLAVFLLFRDNTDHKSQLDLSESDDHRLVLVT